MIQLHDLATTESFYASLLAPAPKPEPEATPEIAAWPLAKAC